MLSVRDVLAAADTDVGGGTAEANDGGIFG